MQPKLPLWAGRILFECVNSECFYDGALMDSDDLVWKDVWNSHIGDLELVPCCPSCREFVIYWEEDNGKENETQFTQNA